MFKQSFAPSRCCYVICSFVCFLFVCLFCLLVSLSVVVFSRRGGGEWSFFLFFFFLLCFVFRLAVLSLRQNDPQN